MLTLNICTFLPICVKLQICHEFERFSTYLHDIKVAVFYGGVNIKIHKDLLKNDCPHVVVGTPGRILALSRDKDLGLKNVRHFILDECDKMLDSLGIFSLHLLFFASLFFVSLPRPALIISKKYKKTFLNFILFHSNINFSAYTVFSFKCY